MHPDLSSHLHSDECNILIQQLLECHKENKIKKFFGFCNDIDSDLVKCFRLEREENRRKNKEAGDAKRKKVFELMRSEGN